MSIPSPRPKPSSLHHSPSLPNIWFPPHAGPHPIPSTYLRRPPTPPFLKMAARRPRKARASYLTPPLTPASSITTATSVDSSPEVEEDFFYDPDKSSSRFVALGIFKIDVPVDALEASVLEALRGTCLDDLSPSSDKVKVVDARKNSGELLLVYHDIRHARLALPYFSGLKSSPLLTFLNANGKDEQVALSVRYVPPEDKMTDPSIACDTDGGFYVSAVPDRLPWQVGTPSAINVRALKNYLRSFGDLQSFTFVRENIEKNILTQTFRIEYFCAKEAATTYQTLNNQTVFGMTLSVYGRSFTAITQFGHSTKKEPKADTATIYSSPNQRYNAASQFIGANTPALNVHDPPCAPQWEGEIRTEHKILCANPDRNCDYCPSRRTPHPFHLPQAPSPPIAICSPPMPHLVMSPPPMPSQPIAIDYNFPHQMFSYQPWSFEKPMPNLPPTLPMSPALIPYSPPISFWPGEDVARLHMPPFTIPGPMECHFPPAMPMTPFQLPPTPPSTDAFTSHHSDSPVSAEESFGRLTLQNGVQVYSAADVPCKNQLIIGRIQDGQDTRTTVMIKNIPNKMNDADLMTYINKVCPRRIDFFYLRMDFKNGCNVGYAFVNFIEAQDVLKFAKARLGAKWNMFSSEKMLQMSYANYQGKEALVEKFKNSCIMDERESWRPRIFYSSGLNQGFPEPFPAPTHNRRKERSSFNRGALYVPGLHTRNTLNSPLSPADGHPPGHRGGRKGDRAAGISA